MTHSPAIPVRSAIPCLLTLFLLLPGCGNPKKNPTDVVQEGGTVQGIVSESTTGQELAAAHV